MPLITLTTVIAAPVETVFNLARSIDLHKKSLAHTHEEAVAGKTTGLIGLHETVTWRAKHFGVWFKLTSKITACNPHTVFADEMISGPFKTMHHTHLFTCKDGCTTMIDAFFYRAPLGFLGQLADALFLEKYMRNILVVRNQTIKKAAENGAECRCFMPYSSV